jgi:uncharacterized membrane protein HdeD (DUF308 family)
MEAARPGPSPSDVERQLGRMWWIPLIAGIAWIIVALVILQFDDASVTTVGVIVGIMFIVTGFQQLLLATIAGGIRWLFVIFGVLFLIAGVIALISPENTFAALADILGFLFLLIGVFWVLQAFSDRNVDPLWWLSLIAGILMVILAFWTAGQFFIDKAYLLLVFAGIWALMQGVRDIVTAFALRSMR